MDFKEFNEPKVTIMMSSYNHEKYVAEAIESVLRQTYANFEFLIADDGSSDNSADIIKTYCNDDRVQFFEFEENTCFKTMDLMRKKASGKYITVIGSDDVWREDKLEKQVAFLENNLEYEACFTWIETIDGKSNIIDDSAVSRNIFFNIENKTTEDWFWNFFYIGSGLAAPTFMMYTDVYKELGGFDYKYSQIHDYELWIRYVQKHNLYLLPEKLLLYRWHVEEGTINISAPSKDGMVRTSNEILNMYQNMIELVEDDFFVRALNRNLINKNCESSEEVMCEKFFLLLNHPKLEAQQAGINYYLKHINDKKFCDCLDKQYGFSRKEFRVMEANRGIIHKMYELEYMVEEYKVLLDRTLTYMETMRNG